MASDGYPSDLISEDVRLDIEPAVLTLAEAYFECGFSQERALDMAWGLALLPEALRERGEGRDW